MYVKVLSEYPHHLAEEVGKTYIEMRKKYPDDRSIAKPVVRAAVEAVDGMFRVTSFYKVKPGKLEESIDRAVERLLMFANIQGYKYTITVAYEAVEALKFIGMEAPE